MKNHGDYQKSDKVRKFRYVSPQSTSTVSSPAHYPKEVSQTSFDFDNVWSIRKNVSVGLSSTDKNLPDSSYSSFKSITPPRTTLFSRHHSSSRQLNPPSMPETTVGKDPSSNDLKKLWLSSNSKKHFALSDDNRLWGTPKQKIHLGFSSLGATDLPVEESEHPHNAETAKSSISATDGCNEKPDAGCHSKFNNSNYNNKYNVAFYNS